MPTMLDFNLSNVPELEVLPDNEEVQLRIEGSKLNEGEKNGREWQNLSVRYSVVGQPNIKTIFHTIWFPSEADDDAQRIQTLDRYRKWLEAHGLPTDGAIDADTDLPGVTAWAIVGQDEYEGEPVNRIKKFVRGA